ncbi:PqqD family protein [Actibacterium pelagium]|uniref:PqqD family protein n=1 Tax=Actibacterium pelagium TaxID=2029103 RepID=UPI00130448C3|nr:PqqD family protein [Actibacterium pelagium]
MLDNCEELLALIDTIMPGWPYRVSSEDNGQSPFFEIGPAKADGKYPTRAIIKGTDPKNLVPVNAICDVSAALSTEPSFLDKGLLCMHTAAVEMNGRLVLFPNNRRAGKSTLTVSMSAKGYPIFTDDYLSLSLDDDMHISGKANGILPRARLPLPNSVEDLLAQGTDLDKSVGNKQYRYIAPFDLPPHGTKCPVGAIVFLDRAEGESTRLESVDPDETIDNLLYQNFGRHVHSGVTLALLSHMAMKLPVLKLKYAEAAEATSYLGEYFSEWTEELPRLDAADAKLIQSKSEGVPPVPPRFDPEKPYAARDGALLKRAGEQTYVSDPEGRTVVRLDPLAQTIWAILEDPMPMAEVISILTEAFPDAPKDKIGEDTLELMKWLCRKALIEAVPVSPADP